MEKTYKILKLIIWVLSIAVVLTGAWVLYGYVNPGPDAAAAAVQETEKAPTPAPDFTVYDQEGNPHKLSDFAGKPVILNFWASWCGPCRSEMPAFQTCYETYADQIHFLMVNLTDGNQETVESASACIAESGYTFPIYFDSDMDAAYKYGVQAIPVTYFIDAQGNFVAYSQGAMSEDVLGQAVDQLLNQ